MTTVIHTAEAEYDLAISDLENTVTAVAGFFKSVVDDIKKAIEVDCLPLFKFENILKNHAYIKNAITNPTDPANPGILDRMASWIKTQQGSGTDFTSALSGLAGARPQPRSAAPPRAPPGRPCSPSRTATATERGLQPRRQQQRQPVHLDAPESRWRIPLALLRPTAVQRPRSADSFDPTVITKALKTFLASAAARVLKQDFAGLPGGGEGGRVRRRTRSQGSQDPAEHRPVGPDDGVPGPGRRLREIRPGRRQRHLEPDRRPGRADR